MSAVVNGDHSLAADAASKGSDISEVANLEPCPAATDRTQYWREYYARAPQRPPAECSLFAQWCHDWCKERDVPANSKLVDIGCGNGRDSAFFARNGAWSVTAVDIAARPDTHNDDFTFVQAGMENLRDKLDGPFDVVYSRFSLHAVPKVVADSAISYSCDALKPGGRLFIEARSVKDALYGQGEPVPGERDAFSARTGHAAAHYRRFLRLDELRDQLRALGFLVEFAQESDAFAPYKDERPVCVRVVARKPQ